MIKHELYKIISSKTVILLVTVVFVINIILLCYTEQEQRGYSAEAYKVLWEEAQALADSEGSWNSVIEWLSEKLEVFSVGRYTDWLAGLTYTGDISAEKALLSDVYEEIDFMSDYPGYLAGIDEAAETYKTISLFGKVDGYAYANIMMMTEAYANIERKELTPTPSAGMEMAASTGVTDILALIVILMVAVMLWIKEREQGMMLLIRTTSGGRLRLATAKIAVLVVVCIFLGIGLYGGNALAGAIMYGLGDLSRPLANVNDYGHTLWEISAGGFLILNALFKVIAYIWIALFMSAICCKLTSSVAAFGGIVAFGAVGCLMYYKIPYLSLWAALKYLNPFGVLKTELLFRDYRSLNFFDNPVDYRMCMAVLLSLGMILFIVLTIKFFTDYVLKGRRRASVAIIRRLERVYISIRRRLEVHTSLFFHEIHRIFVHYMGIIVLGVLVFIVADDAAPYTVKYTSLNSYCEYLYFEELQGPVTQEKLEYIAAEEERVTSSSDDYDKAQKQALRSIRSRLSYIESHDGAYLVYEVPHNRLMASHGSGTDLMRAVMALIPIVLIMPCFFAPDLQSGVNRITDVTLRGKKLGRMRYIIGIVLAVLIAVLVHLAYFAQVMVSYGVDAEVFSYPINSIPQLAVFGNNITIGMYYIIIYTIKTMAVVAGAFLIYGLSRLIKSQAYTTLASLMILVVPFLVAMYDRKIIYAAYPFSAALGNLFVQEKSAGIVCVVMVLVVSATVRIINHIKIKLI